MPKIFLVACEASGDLHASHVVTELKKTDPSFEFRGLGGEKMARAGVTLLFDMTKISALGLGDVIRQYGKYRRIFYQALGDLLAWNPDLVILTDSPAFNLRLAKQIRRQRPHLTILYYISPQIWAWGARRIKTIKKTVTKMLCILPFEIPLYEKAGIPCEFVGHPLVDIVNSRMPRSTLREKMGIAPSQKVIGLLPGSRQSEVRRILPVMLRAASSLERNLPDAVFFLAKSPNVEKAIYEKIIHAFPLKIRLFEEDFHAHISLMDFAWVASGTATLETALVGTPFFLLYKASWSTYFLGKYLIRVPYLGLVNLLLNKKVVPEFIQGGARPDLIARETLALLKDPSRSVEMKQEFSKIREILGEHQASRRAAQAVLNSILNVKSAV